MSNALKVITRGVDSSGRTIKGTRQFFQFYDRVNEEAAKGQLVIVQGGFMGASGADASAGTHRLAMCADFRTWNLTTRTRLGVERYGRNLMGTMWYRSSAQGFDPHLHNNLIGDRPADYSAIAQVASYRDGRNGLANNALDPNPYRPPRIHDYIYLEDDMFEQEDREVLRRVERLLEGERTRDKKDAERDRARFERMVTALGNQADQLTLLINRTEDDVTKIELKKVKENILLALKNDPDVTEKDNPSDDALAEENMG